MKSSGTGSRRLTALLPPLLLSQVLSLLSSTVTTFAVSSLLERCIRAVDIQNATLAGGVAIGASANLLGVKPWGAMAIGTTAGLVSTWGFCRLQPWLEDRGLHDSCGAFTSPYRADQSRSKLCSLAQL